MPTQVIDTTEQLRARLFNWLISLFAILSVLLIVALWTIWQENFLTSFAPTVFGVLVVFLAVWHRRRPARWVRWVFVLAMAVLIPFSDRPEQVLEGRSTIVIVFAPLMAAMVISSQAAGLMTVLGMAMTMILAAASGIPYIFYAHLPGLIVCLLIVFFANGFEGLLAQLTTINLELEDRVRLRTSELQIALEKIQVLDGQRVSFLSVISHELRAPLNNIMGFAQMMQKPETEKRYGTRKAELLGDLNRIGTNAHSLIRLVNEILDLAKMESGHFKIEALPMPVNELVVGTTDEFRPQSEAKSIRLILEDKTTGEVWSQIDTFRVMQVMRNLLSNAFKFTPPGGSITVQIETVPDWLEVSVSDTGPGIAPEHHQSVFEPFRQAGGKSLVSGGTGLGLPICKHIVEAHGGQLLLESTVGVGTTMRIRLPIAVSENEGTSKHV